MYVKDLGLDLLGFTFQLPHWQLGEPEKAVTSLCLHFLICIKGIKIVPTSLDCFDGAVVGSVPGQSWDPVNVSS